jgi:hypothetical protein
MMGIGAGLLAAGIPGFFMHRSDCSGYGSPLAGCPPNGYPYGLPNVLTALGASLLGSFIPLFASELQSYLRYESLQHSVRYSATISPSSIKIHPYVAPTGGGMMASVRF